MTTSRLGGPARVAAAIAAVVLGAGILAGCSSDSSDDATASPSPTSTASPTETSSESASPSRIVAVLCDEATDQQQELISQAMLPGFSVSQLVDVRADDEAEHALMGFVEGPGLAVLAIWIGNGDPLTDLQSADEFAAESSTAPLASDFEATQDFINSAGRCYTTVFAPDDEE
jgi:hypothetical protein